VSPADSSTHAIMATEGGAAPPAEGGVTKSAAKKAKSEAEKFFKKKSDPEGQALIEQGDAAMKEGDLAKAVELYNKATAVCQASTAEGVKKTKAPKEAKEGAEETQKEEGNSAAAKLLLSSPKDNIQSKPMRDGVPDERNYAKNTAEHLAAHLKATGGKYITRFPPEPNGYLHIGHAKAMNFNFGQARIAKAEGFGGETIMRFDDTNPEAEKQEYIDSILANVKWLGNEPVRVTYSSDYFQELYDLAVQLTKDGKAYVCHQTKEEVKKSRDIIRQAHIDHLDKMPPGAESPWRNTSVEENLAKFEKMRTAQYEEGEAFLRMKGDLMSDNPAMWDTVFYRIKYTAHPHSGDKWCIYPTYDYTHCIVDSLENITHSLCTLEFETRQAADGPYYWLLDALRIYKPVTWEYSRCNITYNVLSKRKLNALVMKKVVNGWDDPRLLTLDGLRRRGFTATAINAFCEQIGVTRSGTITTQMHVLENCIRNELDVTARRAFAVLRPLKVTITAGLDAETTFEVPNHPKDASKGSRKVAMSKVIFIEQDDFRLQDQKDYFGLAPEKEVGLLGTGFVLMCSKVNQDKKGNVTSIEATVKARGDSKPKGNLHWVSEGTAVQAELRLYDYLFKVENPNAPPPAAGAVPAAAAAAPAKEAGGAEEDEEEEEGAPGAPSWLEYVNKDSLETLSGALIEPSLLSVAETPGEAFQFQRVGFFCVDKDSTKEKPVFNRVVALKQGPLPVFEAPKPAEAPKGETKGAAKAEGGKKEGGEGAKKEGGEGAKKEKKEKKEKAPAAAAAPAAEAQPEWTKLDLRVGELTKTWHHPDSEKLWCEEINVGEEAPRQVCSGLRAHYEADKFCAGRKVVVVCNLKPAKMAGFESAGMVLCAATADHSKVELLEVPEGAKVGERIFIDGLSGEPFAPNQVDKKKVLKNVLPDLKTDGARVACWQGKPMMTSAGPLTAPSMADTPVG